MTEKGLQKLEAELNELKYERRPKVAADVARFREMGDLRENAEYHAAREELAMIDAKTAQLETKLSCAEIIPEGSVETDSVVFGTRVTVREEGSQEEETFDLVGEGEGDPAQNKILTTSPLGQSLLTKKAGEIAVFKGPRRTVRYKILRIESQD
jgi:transcription elongation factor GreA